MKEDEKSTDETHGGSAAVQSSLRARERVPLLRIALLSIFSAVLLLQIIVTTWSLLAYGHYPRARSGLPPYDGTLFDAASIKAEGGVPFTISWDSTGPAVRIGLREGDLIVAVSGIELREHPETYFTTLLNSSPGDTLRIEWVREGTRHIGSVVLEELPPSTPGIQRTESGLIIRRDIFSWMLIGPFLFFDIAALLVGAIIGFLRIRDSAAFRLGAGLLTSGTLVFASDLWLTSLWPMWVKAPVFFCTYFSTAVTGPMFIGFLAVFPVRTRLGNLLLRFWWVFWILFGAWALGDTLQGASLFYPSFRPLAEALGFLQTDSFSLPMALLVPLVAALLLAQRRVTRRRHIRRMKLFEASFLLFLAGGVFLVLSEWISWSYSSIWSWFVAGFLPQGLLAIAVVVLGYAVVVDRLFDIRFVIRRGLQHLLLSRGMLLGEFVLLFFIVLEALRSARFEFSESMPVVSALAMMSSALVVVAILSLVFSLATIWRRSIIPAIIAHALFDLSQLLLLYVQAGDSWT
jgi:hypothetical protein